MRKSAFVVAVVGALAIGMAAATASADSSALVAGGTEVALGPWTPGEGNIEPGGRIRGWTASFLDTLIGPAGDLASGSGPVTMSCNLDAGLTGPCWGTFTFTNANGSWEGIWRGTFNFVTGAGSYKALAHGKGGLRGLVLENDVVFPGYAVPPQGTGYVFSTVRNPRGF
jgi:hypothetical protein